MKNNPGLRTVAVQITEQNFAGQTGSAIVIDDSNREVVRKLYSSPLANKFADAEAVSFDLKQACDFLDVILEQDKLERPLVYGLWTATIITYGRCFADGVRHAYRFDTNLLDPRHKTLHEFILAMRNKHLAHSVNAFEQGSMFAQLDTSDPAAKPNVGYMSSRMVGPARQQCDDLRELVARVRFLVLNDIESFNAPLFAEVSQMSRPEFDLLPDFTGFKIPGPEDASKARRQRPAGRPRT